MELNLVRGMASLSTYRRGSGSVGVLVSRDSQGRALVNEKGELTLTDMKKAEVLTSLLQPSLAAGFPYFLHP